MPEPTYTQEQLDTTVGMTVRAALAKQREELLAPSSCNVKGHYAINEIGDEGGTFSCAICLAEQRIREELRNLESWKQEALLSMSKIDWQRAGEIMKLAVGQDIPTRIIPWMEAAESREQTATGEALRAAEYVISRELEHSKFTVDDPIAREDTCAHLLSAIHKLTPAAIREAQERHEAKVRSDEQESAWLAERVDVQPPTYVTVSDIGMFELTDDPNKAIRFKRMDDARKMAGLFEFEDVRAREHSWPELERAAGEETK